MGIAQAYRGNHRFDVGCIVVDHNLKTLARRFTSKMIAWFSSQSQFSIVNIVPHLVSVDCYIEKILDIRYRSGIKKVFKQKNVQIKRSP